MKNIVFFIKVLRSETIKNRIHIEVDAVKKAENSIGEPVSIKGEEVFIRFCNFNKKVVGRGKISRDV